MIPIRDALTTGDVVWGESRGDHGPAAMGIPRHQLAFAEARYLTASLSVRLDLAPSASLI